MRNMNNLKVKTINNERQNILSRIKEKSEDLYNKVKTVDERLELNNLELACVLGDMAVMHKQLNNSENFTRFVESYLRGKNINDMLDELVEKIADENE